MQMRSIMRKEMDKAGVKDPQVLDKSYWIQRVGEVWIVVVTVKSVRFVIRNKFCFVNFNSCCIW